MRKSWIEGMAAPVSVAVLVLALVSVGVMGCGETPIDKKKLAGEAGEVAALTYLAVQKPSLEQQALIKGIISKVDDNLNEYKEGGFIATYPGFEELVDKTIPEEKAAERVLAKKLAKLLLEELDKLFERHPDWKTQGAEVAGIVGSFCDGAKKGFETVRSKTL